MAFDYLRANAKRVGLDRDLGQYDLNIQVMSPTHGKDTVDLGVAFYIAILSAIVNKPIAGSLVVMGQMSIHGVLSRVEQLGDRLRVTMDAGARQVLIPTVNAADLGNIPPELLDKVRVDFYTDPSQAAFKAMAEG
jgi:ATP-dependent Lon protease